MASEGFHESPQDLTPLTRDLHRAITSLMEVAVETERAAGHMGP